MASILHKLPIFDRPSTPKQHGNSLAHPAISNGRLYLRAQGAIYCYGLKKK